MKFSLQAYLDTWFPWKRVEECFWPGRGNRSIDIDPELGNLVQQSGIYLVTQSFDYPVEPPHPKSSDVLYIGETGSFKNRIGQFGISAGFWGKPADGHSAGWKWHPRKSEETWLSFFPMKIDDELPGHLLNGLRKLNEALALDEHFTAHHCLPLLNSKSRSVQK